MKKISLFLSGMFLLLAMGSANATLTTIGTATYNGSDYNLIWDDDNIRGGQVSAVPVPGAILLLGSGLIGLVGVSRKKTMKNYKKFLNLNFSISLVLYSCLLNLLLSPMLALGYFPDEIFVNFTKTPPVIDGNIETEEWLNATQMTLTSAQDTQCIFYIMHDNDYVYFAVLAFDDTTNTTPFDTFSTGTFDNIAIWFEKDGADIQAGEYGKGYWLYGNGYLRTNIIIWEYSTTINFQSSAISQVSGPPDRPHMSYELKIPKQEILHTMINNSAKAGIHYWNDYDSGPSFWGPPNVNVFDIETYGNIWFEPADGICIWDFKSDGDVDGDDLKTFVQGFGPLGYNKSDLENFVTDFGRTGCLE